MKKIIIILLVVLIVISGILTGIHFIVKNANDKANEAEHESVSEDKSESKEIVDFSKNPANKGVDKMLVIFSEKSGINFRNCSLLETRRYKVDECNMGIYLVLQSDKETKEAIEKELVANKVMQLNTNEFYTSWLTYVDRINDYAGYKWNCGACESCKCINIADCLFVYNEELDKYTVYVSYIGDNKGYETDER